MRAGRSPARLALLVVPFRVKAGERPLPVCGCTVCERFDQMQETPAAP